MDNTAIIVICLSFIGFVLWILLHRDNETTAKEIYLTYQKIKKERNQLKQQFIPMIHKEYMELDYARLNVMTIGLNPPTREEVMEHLLTGKTRYVSEREKDTTIIRQNEKLGILFSELGNTEVERLYNECLTELDELENREIALKVAPAFYTGDIKKIAEMVKNSRNKLRLLENEAYRQLMIAVKGDEYERSKYKM